ncbi:hypothetical protein ACFSTA_20380 [Ornithinibacillus salinisoli]|uniref:Uncharacterized protein n=1 Tax=Ornithinibacillus salinisoli TaxID=1848459 RepID=A0ABW4W674_9BACI
MLTHSSIEFKSEEIYHSKSKEYFDEVLSSYHNGNYRSAIVMLYTVVVSDLIYKLQELSDRYSDEIATSILEKVKVEQESSPTSPRWEITLISEVKERTNLLESQDKLNIDYLRDQRHLCAHPVLNGQDMLISPNKETVRANMMNMLDGILCKSPLLSKKVINTFLQDLASVKDQLIEETEFKRYLNTKYLSKFNRVTEERLFRDLWKFSFKLSDDTTAENRGVINRTLLFLFEKNRSSFINLIESDSGYYSDINLEDQTIFTNSCYFFSKFPEVYQFMEEPIKILINSKAEENIETFSRCLFLSESMEQHFEEIKNRIEGLLLVPNISDFTRKYLYYFSKEYDVIDGFLDFQIYLTEKSSYSYDDSDYNFKNYILPYGEDFSLEQFQKILEIVNSNSQIHDRRKARLDNSQLKVFIEKRYGDEIDYSEYPNVEF